MTACHCIAIAAAILCTSAAAEEAPSNKAGQVWINAGGLSYHFNRNMGYNERNFGLGAEYKLDAEKSIVAGFYRNSVRHTTRYAGFAWLPIELGALRLGAVAGVADGYPDMHGGRFIPVVLPALVYEGERFGLNFTVLPSVADKVDGAIAVQFKFRFW